MWWLRLGFLETDFETDLYVGDILGCTSMRCVHEEGMTGQREKLTHKEAALRQALELGWLLDLSHIKVGSRLLYPSVNHSEGNLHQAVPCCRGPSPGCGTAVSGQQAMDPARDSYINFGAPGKMKMWGPLFRHQERAFSSLACSIFPPVVVRFVLFCFVFKCNSMSHSLRLGDT